MKPIIRKLLFPFIIIVLSFGNAHLSGAQENDNKVTSDKSSLIVGYRIGGLGNVGVNFEYKLNKVIGIHSGIGYTSFTSGIKLHLNDCASCPFVNLSFKDKGFGSLGTVGAEFSANLVTFRKENPIGLFVQFGYGYIVYISDTFKNDMFGSETPPEGIFTYGLGVRINW